MRLEILEGMPLQIHQVSPGAIWIGMSEDYNASSILYCWQWTSAA